MANYLIRSLLIGLIICSPIAYAQIVSQAYPYGSYEILETIELYDGGLIRKAESKLIQSLDNYPDNPANDRAALIRANIDYSTENYNVAEGRLNEFMAYRPNSPLKPHAALLRGYLAFEHQDYAKAELLLAEAKEISENHAQLRGDSIYLIMAHEALFWKGISQAKQGKHQDAEQSFTLCYQNYPSMQYSDDAIFALGLISEMNRKHELALSYYKTVMAKYSRSNTLLASRIREINNQLILRNPSAALVAIENASITLGHIASEDSIGRLFEPQDFVSNAAEQLLYLRGESYNLLDRYQDAISVFDSFEQTFITSNIHNYATLSKSWAYLNLGDNKKAINYYDIIIKSNEPEVSPVRNIALLYHAIAVKRDGKIENAKKELFDLAVNTNYPYLDLVLLELGQIYYEQENYLEAEKTLARASREALQANTSVRIHLLLGATYFELRKWKEAVSEYSYAEQLAEKSSYIFMPQKDWYLAEARIKRGIALVKQYRNAEAIQAFIAFLAENKNDSREDLAFFWLAEAYFRSDLLQNAADTYNKLLKIYPSTKRREEAFYGLGWSYFRLRDFKKSSDVFDQMIKEYPNSKFSLEVLTRQGDGYYVTKDYRKAAVSYKKASQVAPEEEEGQYSAYQLCHALFRLGDYEGAITELINFVKKYPRSSYAPFALYLNGWIRFQQGRNSEAVDNFKFLISTYPQSNLRPRAYYAIGDCYYNAGDYQSAIDVYKTVIESYNSNPIAQEALKSIQYCYMALGQNDKAMEIADQFIETNPDSPFSVDLKYTRGTMFYTGKKYKDAVAEYESFVQKYPDSDKNPEAFYMMAKSYIKMNELENAKKSLNELLQKYPNSEFAPDGLFELGSFVMESGDMKASDSIFSILMTKYPDDEISAHAGFQRADIALINGDTARALDIYRNVGDKYKGLEYSDQSFWKLGMYYRFKQDYDSSRIHFRYLTERLDNPLLAAEAQFRLGELSMREEDYESAMNEFVALRDKFAGYEDWYSRGLINLGEVFEKFEKWEEALEAYKQLIALRPDDDFGKAAKSRVDRITKKIGR